MHLTVILAKRRVIATNAPFHHLRAGQAPRTPRHPVRTLADGSLVQETEVLHFCVAGQRCLRFEARQARQAAFPHGVSHRRQPPPAGNPIQRCADILAGTFALNSQEFSRMAAAPTRLSFCTGKHPKGRTGLPSGEPCKRRQQTFDFSIMADDDGLARPSVGDVRRCSRCRKAASFGSRRQSKTTHQLHVALALKD